MLTHLIKSQKHTINQIINKIINKRVILFLFLIISFIVQIKFIINSKILRLKNIIDKISKININIDKQ
ncbi:MAG: hypothetical protein Q8835_01295 [Sweet potato little leaf phytoplasma]|nr:hypothetical protein [Sweet potato little leaf phytoplasma]MDV3200843.1 hypothetical protein [Sweet potato little leaf phytoplasma]